MQLTGVQRLNADYSRSDLDELVAVMQSTLLATPSSALRWGNCDPEEVRKWFYSSTNKGLQSEFKMPRISDMKYGPKLPSTPYAEHLVIRDLDLEHLDMVLKEDQNLAKESNGSSSASGRVIAHADYRYIASFATEKDEHEVDANSPNPSIPLPAGFQKELHQIANQLIIQGLTDLFKGLPFFGLYGISTLTPSHLRKGVAKRLTEWVFPFADEWSLPVVLSASPLGLPLYRKCGFEEYRQYDVVIDLTKYGGEGVHRHVMMVRWPKDESKMPEAWKEWKKSHKSEMLDL